MKKIGEISGNATWRSLLPIIILGALYRYVYIRAWHMDEPSWATGVGVILLLVIAFLLMVMHELIHWAMARMMLNKEKVRIKIRIFAWECRVEDYLKRNQYVLYALPPGIITGVIGLAVYYVATQADLRFIGAVMFVIGVSLGAGDYWSVWKTLKFPVDSYVLGSGIGMEVFLRDSAA